MVELTGGIGTQQRQPGTASQPGRRRNEGSPPPGYRAGHLSFVLTLGRPPVTGSVAENRAAPDSLAHTADATQAQNKKAGPAITGGPFGGGSSPLTRPAGDMVPQDCGCRFAPAVVVGALPDQLTGWRKS
jgi:hypothetical protein